MAEGFPCEVPTFAAVTFPELRLKVPRLRLSGIRVGPPLPSRNFIVALLTFSFRVWGRLGRGKGAQSYRSSAPLCFIIVGGVPSRPQDPLGTLGPRLRFPLSPGAFFCRPGHLGPGPIWHPKGARQCFRFSGEGRKRMLPRGASSIRDVFLVLARHERRSRFYGVERSHKTNGGEAPVYGSAFGKRASKSQRCAPLPAASGDFSGN
jgi:hypothetical protein